MSVKCETYIGLSERTISEMIQTGEFPIKSLVPRLNPREIGQEIETGRVKVVLIPSKES